MANNTWNYRLNQIVDLKHQTRILPDGSRIAGMLNGPEELMLYTFEDAKTIVEAVQRGMRISQNGPMLGCRKKQPDGSEPYVWLSYKEVIDRSFDLTYGFIDLGIATKQESFIGIYTKNRPEWFLVELGAHNNRNVLIPLYATLGPESCIYIINETEMRLIVCDDEEKAQSLLKNKDECPSLKCLIIMDDFSDKLVQDAAAKHVDVYRFSDVEKRGRELKVKPILKPCTPDDICTICYTSGTTGKPKGVMLTHKNVIACCSCIHFLKNAALAPKDCLFSFLPLAHMFERFVEVTAFHVGMKVGYYKGDVRQLADDIKELKPTVITIVPRVLNRIYDTVMLEVEKSFIKKTIFDVAVSYKFREYQRGIVRNDSFFDKFVFKRIQENLGNRLRLLITGSAPISEGVMKFAKAALGCIVVEGYGQTECVGAATLAAEADPSSGHVGMPIPCNTFKLVDVPELGYYAKDQTGEVCVRGASVFKGYYKNPGLTKEILGEDGWLHTGDIGEWTSTGTLKIIDRKKHIFKLAQGEYVAPEHIENVYSRSKYVAQSFVYGISLKTCLVGIVVPNFDILQEGSITEKLGLKGLSNKQLCEKPSVKEIILADMTETGKKAALCSFEQVKDIYLCSELFSVENDLLTPTLKSKRPNLKEHFKEQIEQMYSKLS